MVREQLGEVPEHAPVQPEKVELASGAAVIVTGVPALKAVPAGFTVTFPEPVPDLFRVKVNEDIPSWVTVKVLPAMLKVPVREDDSVLARTE